MGAIEVEKRGDITVLRTNGGIHDLETVSKGLGDIVVDVHGSHLDAAALSALILASKGRECYVTGFSVDQLAILRRTQVADIMTGLKDSVEDALYTCKKDHSRYK